MKGKSNQTLILITGIFLISTFFVGCLPDISSKTSWIIDQNKHFHTNDVERAQREVPFDIIFPTYLPDGMDPQKPTVIDGPTKSLGYREVEIEIKYIDADRRIYINEQNVRLTWEPTKELDPVYLDISGIKVLHQKTGMVGSSGRTEGLGFYWNQGDLTISVDIYSISKEEGIKIIESMVTQME
jgi:hypothetical protein